MSPDGDLDPQRTQIADCLLEVRIHGHGLVEWSRLGEAGVAVNKNCRGPLTVATAAFQGHNAKFADLATEA